ncbi:hypothetical protein [Novosphingobium sp. EMRT-2]|uniref:hypothetical protein n=1 Tax=Novosphingobium sp. EMRT-2 TaxID=2571749 RepID=UPI0010BD0FBB|nr:hypothetical protein [Novosphingobium sp. EMRT-2]QCI94440.1 hypothetical protein FA702_13425 [Novosphingobium sp. EMRT-2]
MTNIPDQFYKSRTTAITLSVVAFAVSSIRPESLQQLKIFDVPVGSLNTPFLIVALLAAAAISLASLWLSYYNAIRPYVQGQNEIAERTAPYEQLYKRFAAVIDQIGAQQQSIEAFVHDAEIAKALETPDRIPSRERLARAVSDVWQKEDANYVWQALENRIRLHIHEDGLASVFARAVEETGSAALFERISERVEMLPFAVQGRDIETLLRVLQEQGPPMLAELRETRAGFDKQRRSVKNAMRALRAEVFWLGFLLPALVFGIAALHGIGALGLPLAPSLPEVVRESLS